MKSPKRGTRKRKWFAAAAAATALSWAVLGLLWAQVILLPTPPLLPPTSWAELLGRIPATPRPERFIVMLFKETSLLLTAFALIGLLLCALASRAGARKSSLIATAVCAAILVVSLVPVARAMKTASAEGVPLSLTRYFADLRPVPERFVDRSPETVPYAHSGGENVPDEHLRHLSLLEWEHITLTDPYRYNLDEHETPGQLRPLQMLSPASV
jgi:hypothetical protein